jgi:hypothetical protein
MSHRPPVFTHAADPLDADDWLKTVGKMLTTRVFSTGGNRAVYRGYRCYRWGTVTVPSGSNRSQNSNLNLNSKK